AEAERARCRGCPVVAQSPILETPSAVNKIKQLLKDKPEHVGVKVGVRTRGCNGLSYTLEYTKTKGDSDEEVIQDGSRKARGSLVAHCRNRVTVTCWKIK
uniref:Iron-sulfur cluster assembly 1 n=1 Tax=Theropithecus gelada TaxID=9565 RepID=A0A8D2GKF2_THEGE